jgi:hypothetical protein
VAARSGVGGFDRYAAAVRTVTASVEVPLGLQATWEAAVDWAGQEHWVPASTVRVTGGEGYGATIEARTGWGPLAIRDPMAITAWDPPHRAVLAHTGPVVRGMAIYEMAAIGDERTRFTWTETLEAPAPLLEPFYVVGAPMFAGLVRLALRRFAEWAPTRPT